jgi:hypothetical protein
LGGSGRSRQISEFKASLVYKVSSRTARAIQRNLVLKDQKKKKKKTKQANKQTNKKTIADLCSPLVYAWSMLPGPQFGQFTRYNISTAVFRGLSGRLNELTHGQNRIEPFTQ